MSINTITYAGWVGVDYEVFQFDSIFLGLQGKNGAGKTSLTTALLYTLLPDQSVINIKAISSLEGTHGKTEDSLLGKIDSEAGFAYVALDVLKKDNTRVLVGCHFDITKTGVVINPFSAELTSDFDTFDAFNLDYDEGCYTPDFGEFRSSLAAKHRVVVKAHKNIGDYCNELFEAGLLPTPMDNRRDRSLYAKLLQTSFHGGVSNEVLGNLKHYLLPDAPQIPESVKGMQKCTEDALHTRNTLEAATRQLKLVQATFSSGKSIVNNAINNVVANYSNTFEEYRKNRGLLTASRTEVQKTSELKEQITESIGELLSTKNEMTENLTSTRNQLVGEITDQKLDIQKKQGKFLSDKEDFQVLLDAKGHWEAIVKSSMDSYSEELSADISHLDLRTFLETKRDTLIEEKTVSSLEKKKLIEERKNLESVLNGQTFSILSSTFDCKNANDALCEVSEAEAKVYDLMFAGCSDALIGVHEEQIEKLTYSDDIPSTFWFGLSLPRPERVIEKGDWLLLPAFDGFFATAKSVPGKYGQTALESRLEGLQHRIADKENAIAELERESEALKDNLTLLLEFSASINKYLSDVNKFNKQQQALAIDEAEIKTAETDLRKREQELIELDTEIHRVSVKYDRDIQSLTERQTEVTVKLEKAKSSLIDLKVSRLKYRKSACSWFKQTRVIKAFSEKYDFSLPDREKVTLLSERDYLNQQFSLKSSLSADLDDEPDTAIKFLETTFDYFNANSVLDLWYPLLELLRSSLPSDIETIGDDLLEKMQEKRRTLSEQLASKLEEVSVHSGIVCKSIVSQINSQKKKIEILSEIGRELSFGEVTGLQIKLMPKTHLIDALHKASGQTDLFSTSEQPVEEALHEHMERALRMRISREGVLDYKSYLDLRIEAKRTDSKGWVNAGSLSGGEAIGGGIAVVHMLFMSLTSNSVGLKQHNFNPIYAIDEIHRIDSAGQRAAIEFCKKNDIQLIATAPKFYQMPGSNLYMLARQSQPKEVVVVKRIKGFA